MDIALSAILLLHVHTAIVLYGPGMPRCPVGRRHLILGILLHLRRDAHSCLVVPLAQAPLLSQLPFQLVDVLAPLITEPLPLLPLQRASYVTSQRHAARACPVIGMSCLYNAFCLFREQSLLSGCCNIFVKVINKAVSHAAKRLSPGSVQDISRCLNLTPLSDSLKCSPQLFFLYRAGVRTEEQLMSQVDHRAHLIRPVADLPLKLLLRSPEHQPVLVCCSLCCGLRPF